MLPKGPPEQCGDGATAPQSALHPGARAADNDSVYPPAGHDIGPCVIDYVVQRDPDIAGLCWTMTKTDRGGIYTSGDSEEQLAHNVIECAVTLGYERALVTLANNRR